MRRISKVFAVASGSMAISLLLASCASTDFIVSGAEGGSISSNARGTWVSCAPCKLYAYDTRTGTISLIGPFSDDSANLSYLAGSIGYDSAFDRISFLGSVSGSGDDAAIYTVDASSGRTVRKEPFDFGKYGYGETLIPGKRSRLLGAQP
jgi:hypothetical protein